MSADSEIIAGIFNEGGITLLWEAAVRCWCWSTDTKQPRWGHEPCGGFGVLYGATLFPDDAYAPLSFPDNGEGLRLAGSSQVKGLFRSQSRWISARMEGELDHGEAALTLPVSCKPIYADRRVRDRLTVLQATGDVAEGRVFFPTTQPVPFLFQDQHLGWRVQVTSIEQQDRVTAQP